jgi:hypothetical protein
MATGAKVRFLNVRPFVIVDNPGPRIVVRIIDGRRYLARPIG